MKKLSLLALAAVGMLFSACSDKDEIAQQVVNPVDFKDGAFIGLSLQLPSADNTTRANDELNNGTEDEFAVKNATLYIFKLAKTSDANPDVAATYVDKVSLGNTYEQDNQPAGSGNHEVQSPAIDTKITSTYNQATLIPNELASQMKADTDNNYYAYVILNHNGQVGAETDMTFADFASQEFYEIGADIAAKKNVWETGLVMTNAPISSVAGGQAAPVDPEYSTLVPLDNQKIFGSKAEAESAPAACVYVERAAVKITVEDGRGASAPEINGYAVTIEGWQVINNEPSYFNTRKVNYDGTDTEDWGPYFNDYFTGTTNKYRFVSLYKFNPSLPAGATHTDGFRTYFAYDPQYNKETVTLANTVASDDRPWIPLKDADGNYNHAYTTENTFDVAHQTWENTTMVTLKVSLSKTVDGTVTYPDFYTVGKGSQTMYATVDDAKAAIENIVKNENDVAAALTKLSKEISRNHVDQTVTSGLTVDFTVPTASKTDVEFTISLDYKLNGAAYTSFSTTANSDGDSEASLKDELEAAINGVIMKDGETSDAVLLSFYKGGVSYYNVRIKHFGDVETPWTATGEHIAGGGDGVNEIYFGVANTETPTDAQITKAQNRFLGRYGVVRDNWYKLSVDKIGKIGTAEPVDPSIVTPDTPDDEIENYISVHVHLVPWVLRSQSVQF